MTNNEYNIFLRIYARKHNCAYKFTDLKDIMNSYRFAPKVDYQKWIRENCDIIVDVDEMVYLGYCYKVGKIGKIPKNLVQEFVDKVLYNTEADTQMDMLISKDYVKYLKSIIGYEYDEIMKDVKRIISETEY